MNSSCSLTRNLAGMKYCTTSFVRRCTNAAGDAAPTAFCCSVVYSRLAGHMAYGEVMLALVMRPTSCSKAVVLMLLCASHGDTAAAATMPAGEWLWQED